MHTKAYASENAYKFAYFPFFILHFYSADNDLLFKLSLPLCICVLNILFTYIRMYIHVCMHVSIQMWANDNANDLLFPNVSGEFYAFFLYFPFYLLQFEGIFLTFITQITAMVELRSCRSNCKYWSTNLWTTHCEDNPLIDTKICSYAWDASTFSIKSARQKKIFFFFFF